MEQLYQIHWKALATGATGHGTASLPKDEAKKFADKLNIEHKADKIIHWIEPVKES